MRTALLLLLATSACKLPELTMPQRFIDLDEDGYTEAEGDCEPLNGEIYPGADEYCDNQDNNCNVSIDEEGAIDESTWYLDSDNDGYGALGSPLEACVQPEGFVSNADDCDDQHQTIAPNLLDDCDGIDSDCDGVADDDAHVVWYHDNDGDGYGNPMASSCESEQPSGYVDDHTDCNDDDGKIHPSAPEFCNQNDDNCDGTPDNAAFDAPTWCLDGDNDSLGSPLETQNACVQPASDYIDDCSDCDDGDEGIGGPADCRFPTSWLLSDVGVGPDAELQGSGAAEVGWTLAAANLDGNDYDDLLVGYRDNSVGKLALVWGTPGRRTGPGLLANAADLTLPVDTDSTEEYGTAIQVFPDLNVDDMKEILVGDPSATQAGTLATGAVYAYLSQTGDDYALQARFV
ncbi:MAG: putative metal-binding motif-containing protein, partial [Deltaproteobacteria bacterium]|nr:putative metal-binding motif-containing protein [Deltaproteobacteria bacterium]